MTSPESSIRFRNVQPGQIEEVRRQERPPVRRFDRTPPPRVTLVGVVSEVVEPESGNPIVFVQVGEGAEIECRLGVERFYGEDAKHLETGGQVEITGGDGGDWVVTRTLAEPNAAHVPTTVRTGDGVTQIRDDSVSIRHSTGGRIGQVTADAASTLITHEDAGQNRAYSFEVDADGVSAVGPAAAFYTQPAAGGAATGAPEGALIFGHKSELSPGQAAGAYVAHPIPMLPDNLDLTAPIRVRTDTQGQYILLTDFITDISNMMRISGLAGSRQTPVPGTLSAPTNLRYGYDPGERALAARRPDVSRWDWDRPTQLTGTSREHYILEHISGFASRGSGSLDISSAAATITVVNGNIPDNLPTIADVSYRENGPAGMSSDIRNTLNPQTGRSAGVFASATAAAILFPVSSRGGMRPTPNPTNLNYSPPAGVRVIPARVEQRMIIVSQPGDVIAGMNAITTSGNTITVNYSAVLPVYNGRLENRTTLHSAIVATRDTLTPDVVSSVEIHAYRVRAVHTGSGVISPPSAMSIVAIIYLTTDWNLGPKP